MHPLPIPPATTNTSCCLTALHAPPHSPLHLLRQQQEKKAAAAPAARAVGREELRALIAAKVQPVPVTSDDDFEAPAPSGTGPAAQVRLLQGGGDCRCCCLRCRWRAPGAPVWQTHAPWVTPSRHASCMPPQGGDAAAAAGGSQAAPAAKEKAAWRKVDMGVRQQIYFYFKQRLGVSAAHCCRGPPCAGLLGTAPACMGLGWRAWPRLPPKLPVSSTHCAAGNSACRRRRSAAPRARFCRARCSRSSRPTPSVSGLRLSLLAFTGSTASCRVP